MNNKRRRKLTSLLTFVLALLMCFTTAFAAYDPNVDYSALLMNPNLTPSQRTQYENARQEKINDMFDGDTVKNCFHELVLRETRITPNRARKRPAPIQAKGLPDTPTQMEKAEAMLLQATESMASICLISAFGQRRFRCEGLPQRSGGCPPELGLHRTPCPDQPQNLLQLTVGVVPAGVEIHQREPVAHLTAALPIPYVDADGLGGMARRESRFIEYDEVPSDTTVARVEEGAEAHSGPGILCADVSNALFLSHRYNVEAQHGAHGEECMGDPAGGIHFDPLQSARIPTLHTGDEVPHHLRVAQNPFCPFPHGIQIFFHIDPFRPDCFIHFLSPLP